MQIHGADYLTDNQTKRATAFAQLFNDLTSDELAYFHLILADCRKLTLYDEEAETRDSFGEESAEEAFIALASSDPERLRTMHALRYYPELTREMYAARQPAAAEGEAPAPAAAPVAEV